MERLDKWKSSSRRKPLLLTGARQTGKTWLVTEFGRTRYDSFAYVSMLDNPTMSALFDATIAPDRLIPAISVESGVAIKPQSTLVVFDEVQEVPRALTSLKMFCEQAPEYHVIATGSNLGIALHHGTSFPVGKVNRMRLYPLTFEEFLLALGERGLVELLRSGDLTLIDSFHDRLIELLRYYLYVGGMPEVVGAFADELPATDLSAVREVQDELIEGYRDDFSKHVDEVSTTLRIGQVWESLSAQLARKNKRFVYGLARKGGRGRDFETAIRWLVDAGLVIKVNRARTPLYPLSAYEDAASFKLYMSDVGLLGAMSALDAHAVLEGDRLFREFRGALAEQFACQELLAAHGTPPFYWSADNSSGEIDFLYQEPKSSSIVPVEVKAGRNLQAKSLKTQVKKYGYERAYRFSTLPHRQDGAILDLPLYLIGFSC